MVSSFFKKIKYFIILTQRHAFLDFSEWESVCESETLIICTLTNNRTHYPSEHGTVLRPTELHWPGQYGLILWHNLFFSFGMFLSQVTICFL